MTEQGAKGRPAPSARALVCTHMGLLRMAHGKRSAAHVRMRTDGRPRQQFA